MYLWQLLKLCWVHSLVLFPMEKGRGGTAIKVNCSPNHQPIISTYRIKYVTVSWDPLVIQAIRIHLNSIYFRHWRNMVSHLSPWTICTFKHNPFRLAYGVILGVVCKTFFLHSLFLQSLMCLCSEFFGPVSSRLFFICLMDIFRFDINLSIFRSVWILVTRGRPHIGFR